MPYEWSTKRSKRGGGSGRREWGGEGGEEKGEGERRKDIYCRRRAHDRTPLRFGSVYIIVHTWDIYRYKYLFFPPSLSSLLFRFHASPSYIHVFFSTPLFYTMGLTVRLQGPNSERAQCFAYLNQTQKKQWRRGWREWEQKQVRGERGRRRSSGRCGRRRKKTRKQKK